jgi:hypothetical protein
MRKKWLMNRIMNLVSFSRFYISYLLFNIGGWVYFGYLMQYASFMTTQTCNSYTKELTDVIKILVGIAMSVTTITLAGATNRIGNASANELNVLVLDDVYCGLITTILLLSVSGIMGLTMFGMTSGMTDIQCSNENAEFGLKLSVYGVGWITFIEILLILFKITTFVLRVIANAKLHLLCIPCFNVMTKYKLRRIGVSIPKYNTPHITIPMPMPAKEERKTAVCSVCYDNSITLLLEPCNHVCMCHGCYESLLSKECPLCKTSIATTRKIYFASPGV